MQNRRIRLLRTLTLSLVLVAVLASLAFDSGIGTPSALGIGEFFLLCPLGGLEAMIASRTLLPVALLSMGVVVVLTLTVGRAWCAWGCPAPVVRSLFTGKGKAVASHDADDAQSPLGPKDAASAIAAQQAHVSRTREAPLLERILKAAKSDRRLMVLAGVLVASAVIGFPVFCLVCPIGLTFGTVVSLWRLFVFKEVTVSVLVFPACLILELLVYRKWCMNLCPIAAFLGIFARFATRFRPIVDTSTCIQYTGSATCRVCAKVCPETIDLHDAAASSILADCTRCGTCLEACPKQAIRITRQSSHIALLAPDKASNISKSPPP
ncbi:MAG: 4Fe-4S binding protein [Coriobacteriales bacterium]|jgi:ferredoxin-type protein NapH|nr:4Fe-4S binding protein [Coriobacteriales bacterium]